MPLPTTKRSDLVSVLPIDWLGLHRAYQNYGELEVLVALVRWVEARRMLEIGCRDGRTAKLMLHNVTTLERYVGVDVARGYEPQIVGQRNEMIADPGHLAFSDSRFELIIRERGSLDLAAADFPQPFDVCYIDGDHSAAAVRHDSALALEVTRGLIVWHDYGNAGVEVTGVLDALDLPIKQIERTWFAYLPWNKEPPPCKTSV
jgi:predicted O-methyltransferase YrrM